MAGPKYPTPGSGVRADTQSELERLERLHGGREHERTPVGMPLPSEMLLARTDERTKGISTSTTDIQLRVGKLEGRVGEIDTKVEVLDGKLDLLVDESKESRRERQAREAAAASAQAAREEREERTEQAERELESKREERAAEQKKAEMAFRTQRWVDVLKIVAPIAAAVAMILAALAGAFK